MVLLLITLPIQAQQTTGNLEGRILDSEARPLPEVNVVVSGPNLQGTRRASTVDNGYFRVLALPPGIYDVRMTHISYHDVIFNDVVVALGRTTTLGELKLASKTLEMPEVVISHRRAIIDPTSTTLGGNLDSKTFEALPTERSYLSLATLLPEANASYFGDGTNFAGSSGLENMYFIDGMNVTDGLRAAAATNLPYNFVKEIEVRTGGYKAEFGRAGGGLLNVITHSGSNEYSGQVFGFFTNNDFAGTPSRGTVELNLQSFSSYDIGFSLSGPILYDKLWFFAAYNPTFKQEVISIPGLGSYTDRKTAQLFAVKLNWRPEENTDVIFSTFGDPTVHHRIANPLVGYFGSPAGLENIDPFLAYVEEGGINLTLSAQHRLGSSLLIEGSVSRFDRRQNSRGETIYGRTEPSVIGFDNGIWSGGYVDVNELPSTRTAAKINATLFLADHVLKAGLEYEDNRSHFVWRLTPPGLILRINNSLYEVINFVRDFGLANRVPSAFIQDSWSLTDRLRLNVGLRWDGQFLVGSDGNVAQRITDQLQPRVGFVFQGGESHAQKFFGSYGRFYQQLPMYLSVFAASQFAESGIIYGGDPRAGAAVVDTDFARVNVRVPGVEGLKGQHYDEFVLGYERAITDEIKIGVRGVYRMFRKVIGFGYTAAGLDGPTLFGNPGSGQLSFLPKVQHDYHALEFTLEKSVEAEYGFLASYVLSRAYGNFAGLFNPLVGNVEPNFTLELQLAEQVPNSWGLLPNDRAHSFKFNSWYHFGFGLTIGSTIIWQSGTPLSELGFNSSGAPARYIFLQQRGTLGRTPSIWDLNLRLTYDLAQWISSFARPKIILDVFHIGNTGKPVNLDQIHYLAVDQNGNQTAPNPNYLKVIQYQPPVTVRLGIEASF